MGNITRIITNQSQWIAENEFDLISKENDTVFSSVTKVSIDGKENGHQIGNYNYDEVKDAEEKDFPYGWWTYDYNGKKRVDYDKNDNTGFRSYLEKTVYFQLEVNDKVPLDTTIQFKLYDYDTALGLDNLNPDDDEFEGKEVIKTASVREVDGKKRITIELFLEPKWKNEIAEDRGSFRDGCLDLYWSWEYDNTSWVCSKEIILRIYPSKRTLYLQPAYSGYDFPEIRTSDGDIVLFSAGIGFENDDSKETKRILKEVGDLIKDRAQDKILEKLGKYSDDLRHTIAVRQLRKGKLVNNIGGKEFSRRIYTQPVFDNEGKEYIITKAANFGYRKGGNVITTKGISQIDYFREAGILNTTLKASKELLKIFDFVDLIKYMTGEKPETIPIPYWPLDFIVKLIAPSINDQFKEMWDEAIAEMVEQAKDMGLEGANKLKYTNGGIEKGYDITEIDQDTLDKLLLNGLNTLDEMRTMNNNNNPKPYVLLHHREVDEPIEEIYDIIDCIFIK